MIHHHKQEVGTMLLLCLLLSGCAIKRHVDAYQQRATVECQKHHTKDECRPLHYPACEPGDFGGQQCR